MLKMWDLSDSIVLLFLSWTAGQYKDILGIFGILLTAFYTIWKWRVEYFDRLKRKHEKEEKKPH